jgi:hypothetical protein
MQAAPSTRELVAAHRQVGILARLLQAKKAGKNHRVTFGGHAAIVVYSCIAGNAVWQQAFSSLW